MNESKWGLPLVKMVVEEEEEEEETTKKKNKEMCFFHVC